MRTSRFRLTRLLLLLPVGVACASNPARVDPEEMSAEAHREEAREEQIEAARKQSAYDPSAAQPSPFRDRSNEGDSLAALPLYNPTEGHLRESDWHRTHARAHLTAAEKLERMKSTACEGIPEKERSACPLLIRVTSIDDIRDGVRVTFKEGTDLAPVLKNMQCQQAYARELGYSHEGDACPLYMAGLTIARVKDANAIELTANLPATVESVRHNIRAQAIFSRP